MKLTIFVCQESVHGDTSHKNRNSALPAQVFETDVEVSSPFIRILRAVNRGWYDLMDFARCNFGLYI